jgi:hypothetical protein
MADRNRVLFSEEQGRENIRQALDEGVLVRGSDLKKRILSPIPYEQARDYTMDEVLKGLGFCEVERFFIQHFSIVVLDVGQYGKTFPTLQRVRRYFEENKRRAYKMPLSKNDQDLILDIPTSDRVVRIFCYDYNGFIEEFEVGPGERV